MQGADTSSYEEAVSQLQTISGELSDDISVLQRAGEDCVDNTDNDPAAVSSKEKVDSCVQKLQAQLETIANVITALQEEIEAIQEAAAKAQ